MDSIKRLLSRAGGVALVTMALSASEARAQTARSYFPVFPCRLWDTRAPVGPRGGPKLSANTERCFAVHGICEVPTTAQAAAITLTVVGATDFGDLRAFPTGSPLPVASVVNFRGDGSALANGTIIPIGTDGRVCIHVDMPLGSTGQVHVLGDVFGYFAPPSPPLP
jgi:hypothetical protein